MRKTNFGFSLLTLLLFSSSAFSRATLERRIPLGNTPFSFVSDAQKESFSKENLETKTPLTTQNLIRIISEPEDGLVHYLRLELDENKKIVSLVRESERGDGKQVVSMDHLMKNPAVLARAADRDILILHCENCSPDGGGNLKLDYLYNGMTMSYRHIKMKLNLEQNEWQLFTENKKEKIQTLRLIPRSIFGQLVGIKKILVNR